MPDEANSGFKAFSSQVPPAAPEPAPAPAAVDPAAPEPAPEPEPAIVEPEPAPEPEPAIVEPAAPEPALEEQPETSAPVAEVHGGDQAPKPIPLNETAQALVDKGMDVVVANSMTGPGSNI